MATFLPLTPKAQRFLQAPANVRRFRALITQREQEAADRATAISRATFRSHLGGRPIAPARPGRPTTDGMFTDYIQWLPSGAHKGFIDFDTNRLKTKAPYYLIQEIGTNRTATISNPPGVVSVRSQVGRTIPFNLYWAAGPGGSATDARTGASGEQLYFAAQLNAASLKNVRSRRKRIRREIKGKHYLQAGGVDGLQYLGQHLDADARRIFR